MSYRGDRGRGGPRGGGDRGRGTSPRGGRGSPDFNRGRGSPDRGRGFGGPPRGYGGPDRGRGGFAPRGGPGGREQGGVFRPNNAPVQMDSRLQDTSLDALVSTFSRLTVRPGELPHRPDFGTSGTAIKLRTNFFPIKVPKGPLFEYDVEISPSSNVRRVKRRIFQLFEMTPEYEPHSEYVAHDGSAKLISARDLPQPFVASFPFYDEDEDGPTDDAREYTVKVTFIQNIETTSLVRHLEGNAQYRGYNPLPLIAALNIVLSHHPSRTGVSVGRNRFFFPTDTFNLGGGLEAWKGFYSSVRPAYKELMVNVNVCTTAFYSEGNLANAMIAFQNASWGARLNTFVRGIRVMTTHLGYNSKKSVKRVSTATARQHSFDCAELGGRVTVEEYFRRKYNIRLQHAHDLPLIDVGAQKPNLLPAEVCQIIPGQPFRGKLTDEHTAAMILHACKPPNVNARSIVDQGLGELGFKDTERPLGGFGISIGTEMAVVPGRILIPPAIRYGQGQPRVDEKASWNLRDVRFAVGARLDKWAILVIRDGGRDDFDGPDDPVLQQTAFGFADMCRKSGMAVSQDPPAIQALNLPPKSKDDPTRKASISQIRTVIMKFSKPSLLLVCLSNGDKHIYSGLKHLCDVYLGVHTVCVHSSKIRKERGQLQYFANVALKVNMKLGGVNHGLDDNSMTWFKKSPTMLVGMDVTHPGPGSQKGTPSIAAVVASVDAKFAQYPASLRIQETRKEMITNLSDMIEERLQMFQQKSKTLPTRVLVFRDGVSEGQFYTVVEEELPEIKAAFKKFNTPTAAYNPKLTIVICGKRHHTRFYPTEEGHADQNGNPRPGTVVDRGITAIYDFDFFLQAHGGLQGTTRPTHYYVVHDEIKFGSDELQRLTNSVSYMFARATKAVSLVSPAYYADLACERGRCYIHEMLQAVDGGTTSGSGEDEAMRNAERLWHGGVSNHLKGTMFYL